MPKFPKPVISSVNIPTKFRKVPTLISSAIKSIFPNILAKKSAQKVILTKIAKKWLDAVYVKVLPELTGIVGISMSNLIEKPEPLSNQFLK